MADIFKWQLHSVSTDRKQAAIQDVSTYDTNPRSSYTIGISGSRLGGDRNGGISLEITQDEYDDTIYYFFPEGIPHNGDGFYYFTISYDPPFQGNPERTLNIILTPTTEYNYSNIVSELSEECCSVDFRMDRLTNMLLLGCFLDSIFVIKDRLEVPQEFDAFAAERLIRRAESIIE